MRTATIWRVVATGVLAVGFFGARAGSETGDEIPASGLAVPELKSLDAVMREHMRRNAIPGGALAVVKDGRLLLARGYGCADREARRPVQPTSLFRLASFSKPITGVAMMLLMRNRRVTPETRAFQYLGLKPFLKPGQKEDPRIGEITVRQLLNHTAGWDRDRSGDLMFRHSEVAADMGIPSPPDHVSLIRWAMGRPLDFDPGTRYVYSNFGYCVLGRIIERASGKSYEEFVREKVLRPAGIRAMRIGRGRRSERLPDEVAYYDREDRKTRNIFSQDTEKEVPLPYGFASPQTMDAHGGWVGSAVDLARFAAALDAPRGHPLLSPVERAFMTARPAAPLWRTAAGKPTDTYYACGWSVRPVGKGRVNIGHAGQMPGTSSFLVRLANGYSWAVLFNSDAGGDEIDGMLRRAAAGVRAWPRHDLFSRFPTDGS